MQEQAHLINRGDAAKSVWLRELTDKTLGWVYYNIYLQKGAAGGTDSIPNSGEGEIQEILLCSSEPNEGGTTYATPADFLPTYNVDHWEIDWSPAGTEPTTGDYYYAFVKYRRSEDFSGTAAHDTPVAITGITNGFDPETIIRGLQNQESHPSKWLWYTQKVVAKPTNVGVARTDRCLHLKFGIIENSVKKSPLEITEKCLTHKVFGDAVQNAAADAGTSIAEYTYGSDLLAGRITLDYKDDFAWDGVSTTKETIDASVSDGTVAAPGTYTFAGTGELGYHIFVPGKMHKLTIDATASVPASVIIEVTDGRTVINLGDASAQRTLLGESFPMTGFIYVQFRATGAVNLSDISIVADIDCSGVANTVLPSGSDSFYFLFHDVDNYGGVFSGNIGIEYEVKITTGSLAELFESITEAHKSSALSSYPARVVNPPDDLTEFGSNAGVAGGVPWSGVNTKRVGTSVFYAEQYGTGKTDVEIQAAIDAATAAGGGTVVLAPGTWTLGADVTVSGDSVKIDLNGAYINRDGTVRSLIFNSDLWELYNGTISNVKVYGFDSYGFSIHHITSYHNDGIANIQFSDCSWWFVHDCVINVDNAAGVGIDVVFTVPGKDRMQIHNNNFNGVGIYVNVPSNFSKGMMSVKGNIGSSSQGVGAAFIFDGISDLDFSNNIINGQDTQIVYMANCDNSTVTGNRLYVYTTGAIVNIVRVNNCYGVTVTGNNLFASGNGAKGVSAASSGHITVTGNLIRSGYYGVEIVECHYPNVAGNNIYIFNADTARGIRFYTTGDRYGATCNDNKIIWNDANTVGDHIGIEFDIGGAVGWYDVTCNGNSIVDSVGATAVYALDYGIVLTAVQRFTCNGNTISAERYGIQMNAAGHGTIDGNSITLSNGAGQGIRLYRTGNIHSVTVSGNKIQSHSGAAITQGIMVDPTGTVTACTFTGNTIKYAQYGIQFNIAAYECIITGNRIYAENTGIYFVGPGDACAISGNYLQGRSAYGIRFDSTYNMTTITGNDLQFNPGSGGCGIYAYSGSSVNNVTITGNSVRNLGGTFAAGFDLAGRLEYSTVVGNSIYSCDFGIYLRAGIYGTAVNSNSVYQGITGVSIGIYIPDDIYRSTISQNMLFGKSGAGNYGIYVDGSVDNCAMVGNTMYFYGYGIYINAALGAIEESTIVGNAMSFITVVGVWINYGGVNPSTLVTISGNVLGPAGHNIGLPAGSSNILFTDNNYAGHGAHPADPSITYGSALNGNNQL